MRCTACQRENPSDARFCNGCGQPLTATVTATIQERRPLTVMFADIVDSVRHASALDPEDWRSILVRYHTVCRLAIKDHHGLIRQYLGDGVLAYFGFPSAGETDAANAIRAGLALQARMGELAAAIETEFDIRLEVRVGIHSGLVVVGEAGAGDDTETHAFGNTLNVAARLQGVAAPGSVVISTDTHRLVEGLFECEALGPRQLKGLPEPVDVLQVERAAEVAHRLDAASPGRLSPLIGREKEIRRVLELCDSSTERGASVLLVRGEAGVGKSRLLREVRDRLTSTGGRWLQGRCLPDTAQSPFASLRRLLRDELGSGRLTPPEEAEGGVEAAFLKLGLSDEAARRLSELLGATPASASLALAADHRRRTIEALIEWLRVQAEQRPIVVSIEDLHWSDPSTLAVLARAGASLADAPVCFLLTSRPLFDATLVRAETLELAPLDADESRALLRALGGEALDDDVLAALLERGSGLPLYIEELLRDAAGGAAGQASVPAGLLVSLAARLDQLGPSRELAQSAAVIGEEAPIRLLAKICGRSESQALDEAARIVAAGIARWTHVGEEPALRFSHALMSDAAYDSLPKDRRRQLHSDVARHLATTAHYRSHPEQVARHHEFAGDYLDAMRLWRRAARKAIDGYALDEANAHLERATHSLERIHGGVDASEEMKLWLTQIDYLNMRHGFTGEAQGHAFDRLAQLVGQDGLDPMSEFMALLKLTTQAAAVSRIDVSNRWADRSLAFARSAANPLLTGFAGAPVATARLLSGRYCEARDIARTAFDALGIETTSALQPPLGEAWSMTLCIMAHANAALGHTGEARFQLDLAIDGMRTVQPPDPHSLCQCLYFRGMLLLMEGEIDTLERDAREMIELGDKHGFAEHAAAGRMYEACREMFLGDAENGVARFRKQQAAVPHYEPFAYLDQVLHEGVARAGRIDEAIEGAMELRSELLERGEFFCSEELHAVIGALGFERDGRLEDALDACRQGLEETAERNAQGLRLRIALRTADVLERAERPGEAAHVLEDAIELHPDPDGSRRHSEAVARLARLQLGQPTTGVGD